MSSTHSVDDEMPASSDVQNVPLSDMTKQEGFEHAENARLSRPLSPSLTANVTKFMMVFSISVGFSGWALNFDIGYTGPVLDMLPFNTAFGECAMRPVRHGSHTIMTRVCELTATQQSLGSSIYLLFMALGAAFAGITGNYLGRRRTIQIGCIVLSIGAAAMLGTSGNFVAYIVCKCIGAFGIGHLQSAAPVYGVECTPPHRRGALVTLYSVGAGFGTFVVGLVCLGSSKIQNDWAWKTPIICQIPVALVYACVIQIFPESPRWLLTKGKEEEARNSFGRLYNTEPHSEEITAQIREVQAAIEFEKSISSTISWSEMFHRNFVFRTLISTAIVIGAPISGTFFIFTYAAIFLSGVGIKDPFTIVVVINTCSFTGVLIGPLAVEYLGRRLSILIGYATTALCMLIFSVVSTALGASNHTAEDVLVAFLCIWAFLFGLFIASTLWVASAEMHSIRHRTYAQAFVTMVSNTFVFATNFWTPYMISPEYGNMGTNVGYFYFGLETIFFAVLFFIVPETARLTLEQVDEYFVSGEKAWKTSLAKNRKVAKSAVTSVAKQ